MAIKTAIKSPIFQPSNPPPCNVERAVAQEVSPRPLAAKNQVRARVRLCGICNVGKVALHWLFWELFGFFLSHHSTVALHTHTSSGG
jgi:hypothetical protein